MEAWLNQLEQEGWTLVNILGNGAGSFVIVVARIVVLDIPAAPLEPLENVTDPEEARDSLSEDERARLRWAEETGGAAGEAGAQSQEIGGDAVKESK